MVKHFVVLALASAGICLGDPLTNASALVGISLGSAQISQLPERDGSSPDTVFLGVVRALQTGELPDLYYHFQTNYLASITGYANLQDIPAETVSSFSMVMQDINFSNVIITAYSTSVSNQNVRINALLQENYSQRSLTEALKLALEQDDSTWKIVSYDDDDWNY